MNKLIVAVVLACLASQVDADCLGNWCLFKDKIPVDFDRLDRYLEKNVQTDELDANIAQLRKSSQKLTGSLKRAAEIYIGLADAQQCDDHILELLVKARKYGIDDRKRVWPVIKAHVDELIALCIPHLDQTIQQRLEATDEDLKHFTDIVNPRHMDLSKITYLGWILEGKPVMPEKVDLIDSSHEYELLFKDGFRVKYDSGPQWTSSIDAGKLNLFMTKLARSAGEPKDYFAGEDYNQATGKATRYVNEGNFAAGFKRFLLDPCERFESQFGLPFEAFRAMANFKGREAGVELVKERGAQFRCLAYTHKICQAVQIVDQHDDKTHGPDFNKQDLRHDLIRQLKKYQHQNLDMKN